MSKVWSSGERVGKAPSADLRSRSTLESRSTVIRRSGRRSAMSFSRRNEKPAPTWGDPAGLDWRFVAFVVGWTTFMATCAFVGLAR